MLEVYNSQLLSLYASMDWRFHKLAMVLKCWNKNHFKERSHRMNSFALSLLVVAFL